LVHAWGHQSGLYDNIKMNLRSNRLWGGKSDCAGSHGT